MDNRTSKLFTLILGILVMTSFCFAQSASTIEQTGDLNNTTIQQVGSNNSVDIDQGVMNNQQVLGVLGISGTSVGGSSVGNTANVTQKGGSEAYIYQGGSFSEGDGNNATVRQYSADGSNQAYAIQYGGQNTANVFQGTDGAGVYNNFGATAQMGNENIAEINQRYGNNGAAVSLTHGNQNESHLIQSGNQNAGVVIQADVTPCDVLQLANSEALSTYGGAVVGNHATVSQSDGRNIGGILQTGNFNTATLTQSGNCPNLGAIYQSSNNNEATLTQTGFNLGVIRQMGGDNNVAHVTQSN